MKSYHVTYGGGLESLTLKEHPVPEPGPGEVLVKMHASSFNFRELSILRGNYPLSVRPDLIPVSDGAGEVIAIGKDVTRAKPGDRVTIQIFPKWIDGPFSWEYSAQIGGSLHGTLTEFGLFSEEAVVPIPAHLSYEEAATLPCAALTAWNAVMGGRPLQAGETVLTLGSGGVSLFTLQFAKLAGARVIATTSSPEKAEKLKALGADEVINYREFPDWHLAVKELTNGRGVEKVIEIGSNAVANSIRATSVGGEISLIGRSGILTPDPEGNTNRIDLTLLFMSIASVRPIAVGSRAQFLSMNRAIAAHRMRPVIKKVFSFEEAREAYRYYEAGDHFGKIVIHHE